MQWRTKRFCTASYIIQELRLPCSKRTVHRTLNKAGYRWRAVPKRGKLSGAQLVARKAFVDAHLDKPVAWWRQQFGLVLGGVTLTKAPKPLNQREKHAAQAIKYIWVKNGETLDNSLHTYNRYGVQLGDKVPLWGGFTGQGKFTLRLWTARPKMDKAEWAAWTCQAPLRHFVHRVSMGPTSSLSPHPRTLLTTLAPHRLWQRRC